MTGTREEFDLVEIATDTVVARDVEDLLEDATRRLQDQGLDPKDFTLVRRVVCTGCGRDTSRPHATSCPNVRPSADPAL